ncbi:MAG: Uma2 family endonuclease [Actinobacteria bacterium]|nr:Uma2 family endonuclease [Actinomycetota bacterium]MBO0834814.1 Uma2 family endonuclease [Actinomycetota bacterium]
MSAAVIHEYGPYTLYDLDALPEDGKCYELADGWLTELSPSPWHDHASDRLKDVLRNAAKSAGAEVYVAGGPNDISTPAGVRNPDVFVVPKDIARAAIDRKARTYYASDLLLAAEVISPRSASEQVDRVRKMREYAQAGIPVYWIVDLEPAPKVTTFKLDNGVYVAGAEARAGQIFTTTEPFAISFDPASLAILE